MIHKYHKYLKYANTLTVPRLFKSRMEENQQQEILPDPYPELSLPEVSASEEDLTWEGANPPPLKNTTATKNKIRSYSIPRLILAVSLIIMGLVAGFELGMLGYDPEAATKYKSLMEEHD